MRIVTKQPDYIMRLPVLKAIEKVHSDIPNPAP